MKKVAPARVASTGKSKLTTAGVSRYINKPQVALGAVAIAIALGLSRLPFVESLRPIGEVYLALLQMSVLPFLLAAIPLAMRSIITQGAAGYMLVRLLTWLCLSIVLTAAIGILLSVIGFWLYPISPDMVAAVGGLIGKASGQVDIEFVMDLTRATNTTFENGLNEKGFAEFVPSNIFAALSSNHITGVLIFGGIFGLSMAVTERRSGQSFLFSELKFLHDVCLLIFEWLNLFVPIGIVALIAPQVAQLGSEVLLTLGQFFILFTAGSILLIGGEIVLIATAVRVPIYLTFSAMLKPLSLAAAIRNTIACIPLAFEVMTKEIRVSRVGCELIIPIGFTIFRFGNILHFAAATIFVGTLVGRSFSIPEMLLIGVLSTVASFGTIGLSGPAGLAPLAAVLRPFALSFELALPIMIIIDPLISMLRAAVNVAGSCAIAALAAGRQQADDTLPDPSVATLRAK